MWTLTPAFFIPVVTEISRFYFKSYREDSVFRGSLSVPRRLQVLQEKYSTLKKMLTALGNLVVIWSQRGEDIAAFPEEKVLILLLDLSREGVGKE